MYIKDVFFKIRKKREMHFYNANLLEIMTSKIEEKDIFNLPPFHLKKSDIVWFYNIS